MKPGKYIGLDVETGGIGKDKSLLTAYFLVLDEDLNAIAELDLAIKPQDDIYHVTAEALGINKINLVEHDKIAVKPTEAAYKLYNFLQEHSNGKDGRLTPLGHNVGFDVDFVKCHVIKEDHWNSQVAYGGALDVGGSITFLKFLGLIPKDLKGGLSKIAGYLQVPIEGVHTAKGDVLMSVGIFRKLKLMGAVL